MLSKRVVVPASVLAFALLGTACDDAATKEHKAEQTQSEVDQQKAQAAQQAATKTAEAWDAASQQIDQAQAKADRAWDAAASAFKDETNDYASRINKVVADIDTRLSDLREAAYDAGASQRTLTNDVVANMNKRRAVLVDDETAMEKATDASWQALRLKIDTDLTDSKNYVRTASARITNSPR